MSVELHLKFAGAVLLLLALLHLAFPRRFNWREELARLSLLNRQIFQVHTFFICLVLTLMGALSAFGSALLLEPTPLARLVLLGFAIFFGARLVCQWFVYDSALWRGQRFNTFMHVAFSALWTYLTSVYAFACWSLGG
jgi:cation transport ATPase